MLMYIFNIINLFLENMKVLHCVMLALLVTQSAGFLGFIGDAVNKVVDTAGKILGTAAKTTEDVVDAGVNTASKVITTGTKTAVSVVKTVMDTGVNVFCAVVGVLVPCREVPGGSGYLAPLPIRCNAVADIVLVVDASSSIGASNFKKVLSLVANMAVSFTFGATNVRFGLVVYSTNAQIWLNLNDYSSIFDVQKIILETPYDGGNTYTDRALNIISDTNMFERFGGRPDAPDIVILITDGQSSSPTATINAASRLKQHDVTIFSMGITSSIKESELISVSSRAENVFKATDFDALAGILGQIVEKTCVASNGALERIQTCKTLADIVYAIDSSGSIGPVNYNKLLQFTVDLTQSFKIGTADVLFGGVVFSHSAKKVFDLKDNPTQDSLKRALMSTTYMNSTTHTDLALDLVANQTMFASAAGGRSKARKILIVLTDGLSSDPAKTQVSASHLKSRGIIIVIVGIGQAEDTELKGMASTADDVFKIASFDALSQIRQQVAQRACVKYALGDAYDPVCLQSVSKPLTYAMVLDELGPDVVHQYVGQEPSGQAFNTIGLDPKNRPHNPMVNAGAVVICSLLKQGMNLADKFDYNQQKLRHLAGNEFVSFNNSIFLSERQTADRNFEIGYYLKEKQCFPRGANLHELLDFYFQGITYVLIMSRMWIYFSEILCLFLLKVYAVKNYSLALEKSLLFYDAQRSGKLPANNPVPWRGDSALNDCVVGGWYDNGDHTKFGLPMSAAATLLLWGYQRFKDGYIMAGQASAMLDAIKWPLDYFLKAWDPTTQSLIVQVGDPNADHAWWGRPEDMTMSRPCWVVNTTVRGSDIAAGMAAALAAGSIAFNDSGDSDYSKQLLSAAVSLYTFARAHRGVFKTDGDFYTSTADRDEMCEASAWLYKATRVTSYMNDAKSFTDSYSWGLSWDDKTVSCLQLLYDETHDPQYRNGVVSFLNSFLPGGDVTYTPCGLAWRTKWSPNRFVGNAAFLALVAAESGIDTARYRTWAVEQINYLLGDNNNTGGCFSFEVGYGTNYPTQPHHRSASCPDRPAPCGWDDFNAHTPNPHVLQGALVGGPDADDTFIDARSDYVHNEVATDINAGFQGALAGIVHLQALDALPETHNKCPCDKQ
ncbi:hypothetical protein Btru_055642 [Bulinus truncatus]|nr:hypothetical protein Btru_055642 [Bulinus truncatus]